MLTPTSKTSSSSLNDAFINLKADTGATSTYLRESDTTCAHSLKHITNGPNIFQPDKSTLTTTKTCTIPIHKEISSTAKAAYVVPNLKNSSLLSIGKLCDDNCIALFTKKNLFIFKNNNLLLQGFRNTKDGLWDVLFPKLASQSKPLQNKTKIQSMNYIIQSDKSKHDLATYLHACCFSPCLSTFTRAIQNGNFLSWPGIESINFKKLLPNTEATAKGHLEQEMKHLQTTKQEITKDIEQDFFPSRENKVKECIFKIIELDELNNKSYMDLCGRFPYTSSRGSKYLLIVYDHDSNLIEGIPLKSRNASEITEKWQILYDKITQNTVETTFWILDNEASKLLKSALSTLLKYVA